ncbi:MAG: response regulator transcription factor [Acidobacteriota bacterium]
MDKRVLVIEDEPEIARLAEMHLVDLGCEVTVAPDGLRGLREATTGAYHLVILDLMLPGVDGLEICRRLRADGAAYTPILMLTARSGEVDRVLGLEMGADDYLTKPFSIRELIARVKALFRRLDALSVPSEFKTERLEMGDLAIEPSRRRVTVGGKAVHLTAREFDLLVHFAQHPGRVYTRPELLDQVWGYGHDGYEHTVNSHINRLRSKIERDPARPLYVQTVWGVGYRFVEASELADREEGAENVVEARS